MVDTPFYADWGFWQGLAAFLALFISLIPTIRRLIQGKKLDVHVHDFIHLSHTLGNPNVGLYIMLRNTGGADIRIKRISLTFKSINGNEFSTAGKMYFPDLRENKQVILAPFKLAPDQDWGHNVYFYDDFTRQEDQQYRKITSDLKHNIAAKAAMGLALPVEADPALVKPLQDFFDKKFRWFDDEYQVQVTVDTEGKVKKTEKILRMTIFETDSKELRSYSEQYKTGAGVYFPDHERQPGVSIRLTTK